jgi:hypothetical protein
MKLSSKLAAVLLLLAAALPSRADHTNLVQTLHLQLLGLKQGATTTAGNLTSTSVDAVPVGSRHVIKALGVATGNSFTTDARLMLITPLNGGNSSVEVRDGDAKVDVSGFFYQVLVSASVSSSTSNSRSGRSSGNDYSIQEFVMQDNPDYPPVSLHFSVRGVTVVSSSSSPVAGSSSELSASVSGSGDRDGELLILQGGVDVKGRALEVVPDGPAPGV